jgi:Protein of unknown function (DUF3754)
MNAPSTQDAPGEPYIPIRVPDLVELLIHEVGTPHHPALPAEYIGDLHKLSTALAHRIHRGFHSMLTDLKNAYGPFDPDSDTLQLRDRSDQEIIAGLDQLFTTFTVLLERAGFHHMTRAEIEETMQGASHWGIEMDVCWDVFDRIEVFYRGADAGHRMRRTWWKFFREELVEVPTYRRVVMILKQCEHPRLGHNPDTNSVFLKLFKDIPQMDIEMLIPGTRLRMPKLERGKLGFSVISSFLYAAYKMFMTVSLPALFSGKLIALYTPLALLFGYGYKTVYSYQVSRRTYLLQLAQSLYYQNLDTNAGVMHRLFDDAYEQEVRQALLVYFFAWRFGGATGWTCEQIAQAIVADLTKRIDDTIQLRPRDALTRLERLRLLKKVGSRYVAVSPAEAVKLLAQPNAEPTERRASTWRGYLPAKPATP